MQVEFYPPFRACDLCLTFDGGSVFADFAHDAASGQVRLLRISFDGYGCCGAEGTPPMSREDSQVLLAMAASGAADADVLAPIVRRYFAAHEDGLWADALRQYKLV